ncbi:LamG-like jellyroll fold domain-containing protein [Streptomyces sp. Qhu_M48]|uniref:LamG-like jellyroll fold domain-containing protein n=1 Tax=Streptomyces sp. Qhu_M48 TaxID=3435889 RepID=UPI003F4FB3C1
MKWSRSRPRRRPVALLTALASCASLLGLTAAQPAAASGTELSGAARLGVQQVLFRSGTAGYGCFRIPTLTTTKNGTLLAFAEGRTSPSCADRGPIDIVMRRSTNEGRTWSPIRVVLSGRASAAGPAQVRGNPSPVADVLPDEKGGSVFLFSNSEPAFPGGTRMSWVQRSDDDGLTFRAPTAVPRLTAGKKWFGTGPSHGIQIQKQGHPHHGRLIVGAYETGDDDSQRVGVLYSDDRGATWKSSITEDSFLRAEQVSGLPLAPQRDPDGPVWGPESPVAKPGEPVVAELADGSVYVSARSPYDVRVNTTLPAKYEARHRMHVTATEAVDPADGMTKVKVPGLGFTKGWVGPDVQVSVLAPRKTYRAAPGDLLLMSTPSHASLREGMRIRYSEDKGATWKDAPGGQVSTDLGDRASYSDMAELSAGDIGMLYESGTSFSAQHIYFNRFTVDELDLPGTFAAKGFGLPQKVPAAGRTTPDTTVEANDAYLGNGAASGPGGVLETRKFGQGLKLNGGAGGTKGHADLPWTASLNAGTVDMTYSLFFKYRSTSASPQQALMWAYGVGDPTSQVWIRVQPAENQVMARVKGESGYVTLTVDAPADKLATPAFGDDAWHHLVLTRGGAEIKLAVDTIAPAVTSVDVGRLGPWRRDDVQGIRLGDKLDTGTAEIDVQDGFTGTLDEFRVYREALDATQWPALRGAEPEKVAPRSLKAHLPFEVIDTAGSVSLTDVRIQDDVSGQCADGTLLGTANPETKEVQVAGRINGAALGVSSALPGVEAPCVPAVDSGAGNFTFALWFRYDSAKNPSNAALLSAYGSTNGKPLLSVGVTPSTDRLTARAATTSASATIELEDTGASWAFGDNAWHLLTLTRANDTLSLRVDAGTPATATGVSGSFTDGVTVPEGVRIGSKPDGTEVLTGELDDFRFYKRALSDMERADILDTKMGGWSPPLHPAPTVWWTMEGGNTEQHLVMRPAVDATARGTFDTSAQCNHAMVRGGATVTDGDGRYGRGLGFDGVNDSVELPYGEAEALGDGDFTLATWVRYQAAENDEPVLVRAYGAGTAERQLWIRARTDTNDIVAHVQTDRGITSLVAKAPEKTVFGDGTWRHVVLRRDAGELTLSIGDGSQLLKTATGAVAGSLTYQDGFDVQGILLGTRPEAQPKDWFQGSMDDFILVRKALSDTEITNGAEPLPVDGSTVARLPFETITPRGTHVRL